MASILVILMGLFTAYDLAQTYQCKDSVLTDEDRDFILDLHNSRRSNIAKGLELNGPTTNTQTVPPAKNMYKHSYDCKAEAIIQAYVDKCVYQHSNIWMENLWQGTGHWGVRSALTSAGNLWWAELRNNGVSDAVINSYVFSNGPDTIGHWSMMTWHDSTRIGCGVTNCTTSTGSKVTIGSCVYFWGGNTNGRPIWPIGDACKTDAECDYYISSKCEHSTCLCIAECIDYLSDCATFASKGFCDSTSKYSSWVQQRCPVSCGVCPYDPIKVGDTVECKDNGTSYSCTSFKNSGYCDPSSVYYKFVTGQCAKTCDICPDANYPPNPLATSTKKLDTTTPKVTTLEPTTTKPITVDPTSTKATTLEPTTTKPTTFEATTTKITTQEPTTTKPTTLELTTSEATTIAATSPKITTQEPTTANPATTTAKTPEPTTSKATTHAPTTTKYMTIEPSTNSPTTSEPMTPKPTTQEPWISMATTSESTAGRVTTLEPTTQAITLEPTTIKVATLVPTTAMATTLEPTTAMATTQEPSTTTATTTFATTTPSSTPVVTTSGSNCGQPSSTPDCSLMSRDTLINPNPTSNASIIIQAMYDTSSTWNKTEYHCGLFWINTQWILFRNVYINLNIIPAIENATLTSDEKHQAIYNTTMKFINIYSQRTFFWCVPLGSWGYMGDYLECIDGVSRPCTCPTTCH